jgi:hypothetical protein
MLNPWLKMLNLSHHSIHDHFRVKERWNENKSSDGAWLESRGTQQVHIIEAQFASA